MSVVSTFRVEFCVRKANAGGPGTADVYRRLPRIVVVQAASSHPKDILVPLTNNVTLSGGESIDILAVEPLGLGTEGAGVWQ